MRSMNNWRKVYLEEGLLIPLTYAESALGNHDEENPTWLPEHREQPWTHPHSREFPEGYSYNYHLYGKEFYQGHKHWSESRLFIRQNPFSAEHDGYNMTEEVFEIVTYIKHIVMLLPFWQRRIICQDGNILDEMFDYLRPDYNKID